MKQLKSDQFSPRLEVEYTEQLDNIELGQLCEITKEAILNGDGFNWVNIPDDKTLENYWRGVMIMRERHLFIARLDGQVAGSCQLILPHASNEIGAFKGEIDNFFIASWARKYGLGKILAQAIEDHARLKGCLVLDTSVREDQKAAMAVCTSLNMTCWGTKERHAYVQGKFIAGHFYSKNLDTKDIS